MHVLYRLCDGLGTKPRPDWFTKKGCLLNCLVMFPESKIHVVVDGELTGLLDDYIRWENACSHDVTRVNPRVSFDVVSICQNSGTFLHVLDYALTLPDDEVVYFVEDDYVHRLGSEAVLLDGLNHFDYVTLYDHPDKYGHPTEDYGNEKAVVCRTALSHWKRTRSTTMTFATTVGILREDRDAIRMHCHQEVPLDHHMFMKLGQYGRSLASPIPSYSTHCESAFLAPGVNWKAVFER